MLTLNNAGVSAGIARARYAFLEAFFAKDMLMPEFMPIPRIGHSKGA